MAETIQSPSLNLWARARSMLYLALLTVFVSNFSFYPFGTGFRFSLAVSAFTFYLLINDDVNPALGGVVTGLAILLFRAGGNFLLLDVPLRLAIEQHFPASVYYISLGTGLLLTRRMFRQASLEVILILAMLDVGANLAELALRGDFARLDFFPVVYLLAVVALVRGTLTGLAFTAWQQREHIINQQQRQREFERLLLVTSDVTGELLYLENTLTDVEKIMLQSYQLYNKLKAERREEAEAALAVAREIHDAKKDFQRLAARLHHVLVREQEGPAVAVRTLVDVAVKANQAHAVQQGKNVSICAHIDGQADVEEYHCILSIINNLMGNAIEAITKEGEVWLKVAVTRDCLEICVKDTGVGISAGDIPIIFKPGYTTKFNPQTGQASTGLGLAQVKSIVESLGGKIRVESAVGYGSTFTALMPRGKERSKCSTDSMS